MTSYRTKKTIKLII